MKDQVSKIGEVKTVLQVSQANPTPATCFRPNLAPAVQPTSGLHNQSNPFISNATASLKWTLAPTTQVPMPHDAWFAQPTQELLGVVFATSVETIQTTPSERPPIETAYGTSTNAPGAASLLLKFKTVAHHFFNLSLLVAGQH